MRERQRVRDTPGRAARGPFRPERCAAPAHRQVCIRRARSAPPSTQRAGPIPSAAMTEQPGAPSQDIETALAELRTEATAALERLTTHRDRAAQLRAQADAEIRAYAAEYRSIRARGFFTVARLKELGFTAPRTRQRRVKRST